MRINLFLLILTSVIISSCSRKVYNPTFGVCTGVSKYEQAKAAGYDYIEEGVSGFLLPSKPDSEFFKKLEQQRNEGAKIVSCTGFLPGDLKAVGPEAKHEEILIWADSALRRAQIAGIAYIVFGSGAARKVPDGFSIEEARDQFKDICSRIAPIAGKYNVTIVIEPLNSSETNLINSLAEGADVVEYVNHPNLMLLCDVFHMVADNEPATEIIKYGKYIKHCHIAEKEKRAAPGTGGFDFTPYFDALKKIRYTGCISIECVWDNFDERLAPALEYTKAQYFN